MKLQKMIESGEYAITFYEVDLGMAGTRKGQNHVLRHFEQKIMDKFLPNKNMCRAEAERKTEIRKIEINKLGAKLTGKTETRKKPSYEQN